MNTYFLNAAIDPINAGIIPSCPFLSKKFKIFKDLNGRFTCQDGDHSCSKVRFVISHLKALSS